MITARVSGLDDFGKVIEHVQRASVRALNQAAEAGAREFNQRAAGIRGGTATVIPAHGTINGWASGLRARGKLWRIFDKGSLGKRSARLKRNRQETWEVRRGESTHTAERGDVEGKGIAPRNISNPTRAAGRKALLRGIRTR